MGGGSPRQIQEAPWRSKLFIFSYEKIDKKWLSKLPRPFCNCLWGLYLGTYKFSALEMAWEVIFKPFIGFHGGVHPPWNVDFLIVFLFSMAGAPWDYKIWLKPVKITRSEHPSCILRYFVVGFFFQILWQVFFLGRAEDPGGTPPRLTPWTNCSMPQSEGGFPSPWQPVTRWGDPWLPRCNSLLTHA